MEGQKSDHLLLEAGVRQKVDAGMRKLPVVTEIFYMGKSERETIHERLDSGKETEGFRGGWWGNGLAW